VHAAAVRFCRFKFGFLASNRTRHNVNVGVNPQNYHANAIIAIAVAARCPFSANFG
jgi:hypothetical protein